MAGDFIINTKMDILTFVQSVNNIVNEYFDSDGSYSPHVGITYVMKLFYDKCVQSDRLAEGISENMSDLDIINFLANDDEFIEAFNKELHVGYKRLDFANAYTTAMDIVDDKKSSLNRAINMLENVLTGISEKMLSSLSEESLASLRSMADNMSNVKFDNESLANKYIELKRNAKPASDQ